MRVLRSVVRILPALIIALSFAPGCNKDKSDSANNAGKLQPQKMHTSGLDKQEIDINGDGKPDQFIYTTKEGQIRYAQHDFNFDQVLDMTEFYDEAGNHISDEIDLDYDGIVDLIVTYQNGLPIRKEYSIDFEGNRHGVQLFDSEGNRTMIYRDTDRDGKADLLEYYHPGENEPYKTDTIHTNVDLSQTANLAQKGAASQPAKNTESSQPASAQPAPESAPAQPAPESAPAQPAPEPESAQPVPEPAPAQPAPEPESAQPVPEPAPAQPAPEPAPAQPVPEPAPAQPVAEIGSQNEQPQDNPDNSDTSQP